jgi:hypothetical protein
MNVGSNTVRMLVCRILCRPERVEDSRILGPSPSAWRHLSFSSPLKASMHDDHNRQSEIGPIRQRIFIRATFFACLVRSSSCGTAALVTRAQFTFALQFAKCLANKSSSVFLARPRLRWGVHRRAPNKPCLLFQRLHRGPLKIKRRGRGRAQHPAAAPTRSSRGPGPPSTRCHAPSLEQNRKQSHMLNHAN